MPHFPSKMQSLLDRGRSLLQTNPSSAATSKTTSANGSDDSDNAAPNGEFKTVKVETRLFVKTEAQVDGEECLHDCSSCTISYPKKFSIEEDDKLYGQVKGWDTHLIVGTGKTDWVRDVADEKGSVMQAIEKHGVEYECRGKGKGGKAKLKLSASNLPTGSQFGDADMEEGSNCMLLPSWQLIEHVQPAEVPDLMREVIEQSVTNTMRLPQHANAANATNATNGDKVEENPPIPAPTPSRFHPRTRPIPHQALILMCSHRTRDARCGQSAPLLRSEFERHLRPLGLYRDLHDERPGGVGVYFINHVGGHKYSANVIIYRKRGAFSSLSSSNTTTNGSTAESGDGDGEGEGDGEASQGIWLARVRPGDCENIVRYTVLQGKVVKPETQLRGGFDRERGLLSW